MKKGHGLPDHFRPYIFRSSIEPVCKTGVSGYHFWRRRRSSTKAVKRMEVGVGHISGTVG